MKRLPQTLRDWIRLSVILAIITMVFVAPLIFITSMPGHSYSGPLQPLSTDEVVLRDNLKTHVSILASEIGERSIDQYENLQRSVEYIEGALLGYGYQVTGHEYQARGKTVKNIGVEIGGKNYRGGPLS